MELLDVYDKHGNLVGELERDKAHSKNTKVFHKAIHIWIVNSKGELLIQKRAACKKTSPNKWDISAAGHVDKGEKLLTSCERELFEELGIKLEFGDFIYVGEMLHKDQHELTEQFIVKLDVDLSKVKLQIEEVSEVKWINISDFKELVYSSDFLDHSKEYKDFMFRFLNLHFGK